MKFDMGQTTLSTLAKQTGGAGDEMGTLIKQLVASVEPLEGNFNGAGRAAFDSFKGRADQVTVELKSSLSAILGGQTGMDTAFGQGDTDLSDNSRRGEQTANFDGARFSARA
jgi:hypothetical protein